MYIIGTPLKRYAVFYLYFFFIVVQFFYYNKKTMPRRPWPHFRHTHGVVNRKDIKEEVCLVLGWKLRTGNDPELFRRSLCTYCTLFPSSQCSRSLLRKSMDTEGLTGVKWVGKEHKDSKNSGERLHKHLNILATWQLHGFPFFLNLFHCLSLCFTAVSSQNMKICLSYYGEVCGAFK